MPLKGRDTDDTSMHVCVHRYPQESRWSSIRQSMSFFCSVLSSPLTLQFEDMLDQTLVTSAGILCGHGNTQHDINLANRHIVGDVSRQLVIASDSAFDYGVGHARLRVRIVFS
jgi:hypothetical protein